MTCGKHVQIKMVTNRGNFLFKFFNLKISTNVYKEHDIESVLT